MCSIITVKPRGSGIGSVGSWFKRIPLIPATGAKMWTTTTKISHSLAARTSTCEGWTVTVTTGMTIVYGASTVVAHLVLRHITVLQLAIRTIFYALIETWTIRLHLVGSWREHLASTTIIESKQLQVTYSRNFGEVPVFKNRWFGNFRSSKVTKINLKSHQFKPSAYMPQYNLEPPISTNACMRNAHQSYPLYSIVLINTRLIFSLIPDHVIAETDWYGNLESVKSTHHTACSYMYLTF